MRLSVAMTTFDGAAYLESQVRSILTQTVRVDEIVVADDGSTDGTLDLLAALGGEAARAGVHLRVLDSGGRLGVTANFERAVTATSGDLIFLSDHDDVWHPDRVETAVEALGDGVLLQHADADLVDGAGAPTGSGLFESLHVRASERRAVASGSALGVYLRRNLATGAVTVFRRELLASATPFPGEWVHDEWLAVIAAARGGVQLLDCRLIDYRQHGANQIGVTDPAAVARLRRMLGSRADRYHTLAARARVLEARLGELGLPPAIREQVTAKRAFEDARSRYPEARIARLGPVLLHWVRGDYHRYSSQRSLDVIRDLLQPA